MLAMKMVQSSPRGKHRWRIGKGKRFKASSTARRTSGEMVVL